MIRKGVMMNYNGRLENVKDELYLSSKISNDLIVDNIYNGEY